MSHLPNDPSVDDRLRAVLRPGQDIVIAQAYGFPVTLVAALARHQDLLEGSRLFVGMTPFDIPPLAGVRFETMFPSGPFGTAEGLAARGARYHRASLYSVARAFRDAERPVDLCLATATPARDGRHSLGLAVDFIHPAAERADAVLLEIVDDLPWTGAASTVAAGGSVLTVPSGRRAMTLEAGEPGDTRLADHILPWIPDGATLELGMGRWFEPLIGRLAETRRGLRLHTGSLSGWVMPLIQSGALDPAGPLVVTAAGGSRAFYDAIPELEITLAPAHVTHAPEVLRTLPRFRAINSVLEVDLLGRANSEFGAKGRRGGLGGLPDYAAGAAANPDGLSIVALSAVAGGASRIVARLPEDHVSLPQGQVEVLVTEFGSADLRDKSAAERASAILALAAPQFRADLEREARELELI